MVRLAPRIHRPCAVGAISTGKPASTPTASPRPARGGQAARNATGALVDLAPGVADGFVGFTGDHARRGGSGVEVHLLGKPAHKNLLGSGAFPKARNLIFRLLAGTLQQAPEHSWAAVR